jgi:hypothetical protein
MHHSSHPLMNTYTTGLVVWNVFLIWHVVNEIPSRSVPAAMLLSCIPTVHSSCLQRDSSVHSGQPLSTTVSWRIHWHWSPTSTHHPSVHFHSQLELRAIVLLKHSKMKLSPSWEAASRSAAQEFCQHFMESENSITMFTIDHHWSLSWARWIQSTPPNL